MAQNHDLELALTAAPGEQPNETTEEPIQQTGQQDAQSEPLRPSSPAPPSTAESSFFTPHVEGDLLADYDPYPLRGDLAAARAEMARSRYDHNHDGRCDASACRRIVAYGVPPSSWQLRGTDALIQRDLARVGVHLAIRHVLLQEAFPLVGRPRTRVALILTTGWFVDFPDAASFAPVLQHPSEIDNLDFSLLGAAPSQLRRWGYQRRSVPSVDSKIAECGALLGDLRVRCWAELDQLLTERIVPWLPRAQEEFAAVTSARVARYSFDQFATAPALDRIALEHASG
jgi:hypothetical protein